MNEFGKKIIEDATYGVEVEFYANDYDDAYESANRHLCVTGDDSLSGEDGTEVKFARGVKESEFEDFFASLSHLVETNLDCFSERCDEGTYLGKCDNVDDDMGCTGLHIHIGINHNYSVCDLIRLIQLTEKNHSIITQLAWRDNREWASGSGCILSSLRNCCNEIIQGRRNELYICSGKSYGLNVDTNYEKTVEFRYGHASLVTDKVHFEEYRKYIKSLVGRAFTGEQTVQMGDYTITETSGLGINYNRRLKISKGGQEKEAYCDI